MNLSEMQRYAKQKGYGEIVKIIVESTVLFVGWEMDNDCWLVEMKDGSTKLFTTNHGGFCPMSDKEVQTAIKVAQDSLEGLNNIVKLMKGI